MQCHTSAEGHPYRKFSWGNKKSLVEDVEKAAGEPLRSLLLKARAARFRCLGHASSHPVTLLTSLNLKLVSSPRSRFFSALLQHHKEHYRADRMTLVLLGPEDLDTLEAWTKELFGPVPGGGGPRPSIKAAGAGVALAASGNDSLRPRGDISFDSATPAFPL